MVAERGGTVQKLPRATQSSEFHALSHLSPLFPVPDMWWPEIFAVCRVFEKGQTVAPNSGKMAICEKLANQTLLMRRFFVNQFSFRAHGGGALSCRSPP